jgi:hypothetical protein
VQQQAAAALHQHARAESHNSMTDAAGDVEAAQPLRPLNLSLPPIGPLATDMIVAAEASGASTAPIYPQRFYSFGNARTLGTHLSEAKGRPRYMRQNTVAGEAVGAAHFPHFFQRAISRTHTMHSTASSLPVEEWKILFEKLDLESDGRVSEDVIGYTDDVTLIEDMSVFLAADGDGVAAAVTRDLGGRSGVDGHDPARGAGVHPHKSRQEQRRQA